MRRRIIILLVIAGLAAGVSYPVYKFLDRYGNEARAYAEDVVCDVASYWRPQSLYDRGSDLYKQYHDLPSAFAFCAQNRARFGPLQTFEHPYGSLGVDLRSGVGVVLTGDYTIAGDFVGSKGTITISIAKIGGEWKVDNIQMFPGLLPDYESHAVERARAPVRPQEPQGADSAASP